MYEALPFPQREGDHAEMARHVVEPLKRHGAPEAGRWVDLGCGTGEILAGFAGMNPGMKLVGLDFSRRSLELAQRQIDKQGLKNVSVMWADISLPDWTSPLCDVITAMGSIIVMPEPRAGFAQASKALRPSGLFAFYFYGTYGRYDRSLRQRLLSTLVPEADAFRDRVELAKKIFDPKMHTGEPMEDQWIADQYAHPSEHTFTITEIYDILESNGMELVEWLYVSERPGDHFQDPEVIARCERLSRRDLLTVFDLLTRKVDNIVIARKRGAA
jgi:SAM-dependent methyltransferase